MQVNDLLSRTKLDPALAQAIAAADADGNGTLSLEELVEVFSRERGAHKKARRMWKLAVALACLLVVVLAANAGLVRWAGGSFH